VLLGVPPLPKIEFTPLNDINITHKDIITTNNLMDIIFQLAINITIINKNLENIINHINNE
jgi:hypothetical protein